ncbi:LuxR C-terminal-related transcriptional regulator [Actinoplanes sp. NPDC051470]|uniref:LuxR C-terminal-related transcriptional regulator n=1 Tax=Actinoplanes sp. NPDC051470 TaxID=3157224 RepID=UPI00341970AF
MEDFGTAEPIAAELSCSVRTVKAIVQGAMRRLGPRNRAHAVAFAIRHGLI